MRDVKHNLIQNVSMPKFYVMYVYTWGFTLKSRLIKLAQNKVYCAYCIQWMYALIIYAFSEKVKTRYATCTYFEFN